VPGIVSVVGLVAAGVLLQITSNREALALVAVLAGAAALIYQIRITHYFWNTTLGGGFDADAAGEPEEPGP